MARDWRTARVFISSTFRDMHAERDYLTRVAFPELRARLYRLGATLVDVDLRWGVTQAEAEDVGALGICLDEIERCRPFFICLLGHRYGWVPLPEQIPVPCFDAAMGDHSPEVEWTQVLADLYALDQSSVPPTYRLRRDARHSLDDRTKERLCEFLEHHGLESAGQSITAREIMRGVFDSGFPPTHAMFYLRRPQAYENPGFPSAFREVFEEKELRRQRQLDGLKRRLQADERQFVIREYSVDYAGVHIDPALAPASSTQAELQILSEGLVRPDEWERLGPEAQELLKRRGTVAWSGLEEFGERVIEDLWEAIQQEFCSEDNQEARSEASEEEQLLCSRFQQFIGREGALAQLLDYASGGAPGAVQIVHGPSGAGKSALIAEFSRLCRSRFPDFIVVTRFASVTPNSQNIVSIIQSICKSLRHECQIDRPVSQIPGHVVAEFADFLRAAAETRPVVVTVDAIDQLDDGGALDWIPGELPDDVRLIVSTTDEAQVRRLGNRLPRLQHLSIGHLDRSEQQRLIEEFLSERRKRLTAAQIERMLDVDRRPDVGLPLYLTVALEELCFYGDYFTLEQRIDDLPPTVAELLMQVLRRVEQDYGSELTRTILGWLAVSRAGLDEETLLSMLRQRDSDFPLFRVARFIHSIGRYVATTTDPSERLRLFHRQWTAAIRQKYFRTPEQENTPHVEIGRHCLSRLRTADGRWSDGDLFAWNEVAFHLAAGHALAELKLLAEHGFLTALAARLGNTVALENGRRIATRLADYASNSWRSLLAVASEYANISAHVRNRNRECVDLLRDGLISRVNLAIEQEVDASRRSVLVLAVSTLLEAMGQPEAASELSLRFFAAISTAEQSFFQRLIDRSRNRGPTHHPAPLSPATPESPLDPLSSSTAMRALTLFDRIAIWALNRSMMLIIATLLIPALATTIAATFAARVMGIWGTTQTAIAFTTLMVAGLPFAAVWLAVLLCRDRLVARIWMLVAQPAARPDNDVLVTEEAFALYRPLNEMSQLPESLEVAIANVAFKALQRSPDPTVSARLVGRLTAAQPGRPLYDRMSSFLDQADVTWLEAVCRNLFNQPDNIGNILHVPGYFGGVIAHCHDPVILAKLAECARLHSIRTARIDPRLGDQRKQALQWDEANLAILSQAEPTILAESLLAWLDGATDELRPSTLDQKWPWLVPALTRMRTITMRRDIPRPAGALTDRCHDLWTWLRGAGFPRRAGGDSWIQSLVQTLVAIEIRVAGRIPELTTRLLSTDRLKQVFRQLAERRLEAPGKLIVAAMHDAALVAAIDAAVSDPSHVPSQAIRESEDVEQFERALPPRRPLLNHAIVLTSFVLIVIAVTRFVAPPTVPVHGPLLRPFVLTAVAPMLVLLIGQCLLSTAKWLTESTHSRTRRLAQLQQSSHGETQSAIDTVRRILSQAAVILVGLGGMISLFLPFISAWLICKPHSFNDLNSGEAAFIGSCGYVWMLIELIAWFVIAPHVALYWRGANLLYPQPRTLWTQRLQVAIMALTLAAIIGLLYGVSLPVLQFASDSSNPPWSVY